MKKKFIYALLFLFVLVNIITFNQAYHFSHFNDNVRVKTSKPEKLSALGKINVLLFGIKNPKPANDCIPIRNFDTVFFKTHHNYTLSAWQINVNNSKGTVILFHGYTGKKSDMLDEAERFNEFGYNTLLVDFFGSGDSDGNTTTLGFYEAYDVVNAFEYVKKQSSGKIILFGASMGAVSILKAVSAFKLEPDGIILECPYGKLITTVRNRFKVMGVPSFGLAEMLVFWGGIQNGYWGFSMNAIHFANNIHVPVLIFHGAKDKRASLEEVSAIYSNLKGKKSMKIFENAEHESFIVNYEKEWVDEITGFLSQRQMD